MVGDSVWGLHYIVLQPSAVLSSGDLHVFVIGIRPHKKAVQEENTLVRLLSKLTTDIVYPLCAAIQYRNSVRSSCRVLPCQVPLQVSPRGEVSPHSAVSRKPLERQLPVSTNPRRPHTKSFLHQDDGAKADVSPDMGGTTRGRGGCQTEACRLKYSRNCK